jgi:hypothetical protein
LTEERDALIAEDGIPEIFVRGWAEDTRPDGREKPIVPRINLQSRLRMEKKGLSI